MKYIIVRQNANGSKSYLFSNRTGFPEWVSEKCQAKIYKADAALSVKNEVEKFTVSPITLEESN